MELCRKERFWKLPAELFDESGHIVGEGCGQTRLPIIQLSLEQTKDVFHPNQITSLVVLLKTGRYKSIKAVSFVTLVMLSITTIRKSRNSRSYPDGLDARKRAWLSEQAYSRSTLQKKRTSVYQKAETQHTQGSCLSCCFTRLEQRNPSEPTALTHHGTSPNSGMYLLGKFSKGTPKIFAPLM